MTKGMTKRITDALAEIDKASMGPSPYPFLPEIKKALEAMLASGAMAERELERLSGALGRLVTDNYSFSESDLGTTLLSLGDEFAASH